MAPFAVHHVIPQPGRLTPDQTLALGELWSFLLHLWYSESCGNHTAESQSSSPAASKWRGLGMKSLLLHKVDQTNGKANEKREDHGPSNPSLLSPDFSPMTASYYHLHATTSCNPSPPSPDLLSSAMTNKVVQLRQRWSNILSMAIKPKWLKPWAAFVSGKFKCKYGPAIYHDAFWTWVQNEHPDSILIRSLKAREWKAERAMEHLMTALEWRITQGIHELSVLDEQALDHKYPGFVYLLERGRVALLGYDRHGHPLQFGNVSLDGHPYHVAQRVVMFYGAEHLRLLLKPPNDICSGLMDLSTLTLSDIKLLNPSFITQADCNYSQSMGIGAVYKPPWVFHTAWKIGSPFLEPHVRQQVKFLSTIEQVEELYGRSVVGPILAKTDSPTLQCDSPTSSPAGSDDQLAPMLAKKDQSTGESKDKTVSPFACPYLPPVPGENDRFHQDSENKLRVLANHKGLELTFEEQTMAWLEQSVRGTISDKALQERSELGYRLIDAFWMAEPYVKVRTVFHRLGTIQTPKSFFPGDSGFELDSGAVNDLASLSSPTE